ncbi:MAG TPA: DUF1344 domain-containing protein [Devosia sp.]|nr:DUF1344 domain-containing protein [Devosia sp.]
MRNILVPAAIAILLGSSGLAMAAGTAPAAAAARPAATATATPQSFTGTVKSFDLNKHMLTLSNGIAYVLPTTFKDPGLKVGQKVTVKWMMKGTQYDAQSVTIG